MMDVIAQFMSDCRTASTYHEVEAKFKQAFRVFGAETGTVSCLGSTSNLLNSLKVVGSPDSEFVRNYAENNFIRYDPAAKKSVSTLSGFSWDECRFESRDDPRALHVLDVADDFGYKNGFVVPIHSGLGNFSVVTFTGDHLELNPTTRGCLHLIAIYYHVALERLMLIDTAVSKPELTARQKEVLRWVSAGKTDWEIGQILSISEATVNRHVERAKERIGVRTRAQAIVECLVNGIVSL
ncbi:HTH-type quorum sensing-dependent transcriptional regulator RpaR [Candidatus Phycosocius bacilliformis]|uniref:HTH-type quorum sensing-dependent transcriptional regulator RpaR n=1 Tax=Candidatus Phycosocius bacilliformis TaxID=1445552 RepID=A0A2P2EDG9_9PROT|nr:LuxR family transcriptional regulator [Candidatus Phycosocius bacilliformis]GBF59107.1 HTH-type quorum sensing-dependent transcriptional regulator RpaR [Candidatus Phycosocius bacilliformis]